MLNEVVGGVQYEYSTVPSLWPLLISCMIESSLAVGNHKFERENQCIADHYMSKWTQNKNKIV